VSASSPSPVSSDTMSDYARAVTSWCAQPVAWAWKQLPAIPLPRAGGSSTEVIVREIREMLPSQGRGFVRLAGLSGAMAVALGAYGKHEFKRSEANEDLKEIFDTANNYHMLTSITLLALPLSNRPRLAGTLLTSGMLLFSGSCYYHAMTGNKGMRAVTPYGGMLLIAGWIALAL